MKYSDQETLEAAQALLFAGRETELRRVFYGRNFTVVINEIADKNARNWVDNFPGVLILAFDDTTDFIQLTLRAYNRCKSPYL